ncbi:MAG: hypothetical protein AAGG07_04160 [Planctomycetota bacterium]
MSERRPQRRPGGIVHTYLGYDPKRFPSPTQPPPDLASHAMEHMLHYGSTRHLTPEELANAIELDPSQIAGLGPSLDALLAMLEERKRKILETYETGSVRAHAHRDYEDLAQSLRPPSKLAKDYFNAVRNEQLPDLERLWYRADRTAKKHEPDAFRDGLLHLSEALGAKYEVEQLASKYEFTGREPLTIEEALAVKEELEAIDELLEQLAEAAKNAQVAIIDLEQLARFAKDADLDQLRGLQQQVEEMMRQMAEDQGLELDGGSFRLTPQATKLFQGKVLSEIFGGLNAARSGRHTGPIEGEGVVELPATRAYEFGDSASQMDIPQSFVNAMLRQQREGGLGDGSVRLRPEDIEVHRTRNNPKAATAVLMDMSGSMRYGGQYVACKRMALALDGLIRREYPGDFLAMFEIASLAKRVLPGQVPALMPKPVTIRDPVVRLKADMADPDMSEAVIPPHFTNIQHGLRLARRVLAAQDTPNRSICLITDGLPTAHHGPGEDGSDSRYLYLLYPPDPTTEEATMREAAACARDGITINFFVIPSWSQSEDDIQFAHRVAETTRGRVFFAAGDELSRFVLWDYVKSRRSIIG